MNDNEHSFLVEETSTLPPRSEKHGSKKNLKKKLKKVKEQKEEDDEEVSSFGINFQLIFLRILVLLFLSMIVLTFLYPNWLQKL